MLPQLVVLVLLCASLTTLAAPTVAQEGMFVTTGSMNTGRTEHTATLLNNGTVLIAGGPGSRHRTWLLSISQRRAYNPATGAFTLTGVMSTARTEHTATLLNNGTVLVAGETPALALSFLSHGGVVRPCDADIHVHR